MNGKYISEGPWGVGGYLIECDECFHEFGWCQEESDAEEMAKSYYKDCPKCAAKSAAEEARK